MKKVLCLIALASLVGCGFSAASQRSESTLTYDDGVHPPMRTTATSNGDSSRLLLGLAPSAPVPGAPSVYPPFGYGYGASPYGTYGSQPGTQFMPANGCQVNPYLCPVWVSTPVYNVGGALAPASASPAPPATSGGKVIDTPKAPTADTRMGTVEDRLTQTEVRVHALAKLSKFGVTVNTTWCKGFLAKPEMPGLEPADIESTKATCQEILGK